VFLRAIFAGIFYFFTFYTFYFSPILLRGFNSSTRDLAALLFFFYAMANNHRCRNLDTESPTPRYLAVCSDAYYVPTALPFTINHDYHKTTFILYIYNSALYNENVMRLQNNAKVSKS